MPNLGAALEVPKVTSSGAPDVGAAATDPTAQPQLDENATLAATSTLTARARRTLAGDTGPMSDAGFRLDIEGGYRRAASVNLAGSELLGDSLPATFLPPSLAGGGSVRLRTTVPLGSSTRPGEERATLSLGVGASATAAIDTEGVDRSVAIINQAAAAYAKAQALGGDITKLLEEFQGSDTVGRLRELGQKAESGESLTLAEIAEVIGLAEDLETQMRTASTTLAELPRLFDDLDATVAALGDGAMEMRVDALASGYVTQTIGARTPTLHLDRGGRHLLDAAAEVRVIEPLPLPSVARDAIGAIDDLVRLRSAMVSIRGYVDIQVHGLDELRATLAQARTDAEALSGSLSSTADAIGAATDDPASLSSTAAELDASLATLQDQGTALGRSAGQIAQGLSFETEAGLEVAQPTAAVGVGVGELSLRYRFRPSEKTEFAARLYVEDLAGMLSGDRDRLRYDPSSGGFVHASHTEDNVYHDFFPTVAGLDLGLSLGRGSEHQTDIIAGIGIGSGVVGAHVGLRQDVVRRLGFELGVVDPNLTAAEGHLLLPQAGLRFDVGSRADPEAVSLALSGGAAARWAADLRGGLHPTLDGGNARLTLSVLR